MITISALLIRFFENLISLRYRRINIFNINYSTYEFMSYNLYFFTIPPPPPRGNFILRSPLPILYTWMGGRMSEISVVFFFYSSFILTSAKRKKIKCEIQLRPPIRLRNVFWTVPPSSSSRLKILILAAESLFFSHQAFDGNLDKNILNFRDDIFTTRTRFR